MNNNKMNRLLTSDTKNIAQTSGANGVLSRLFRSILKDLGINVHRFEYLMQDYLHDSRNGVPNTRQHQTLARGNCVKEFSKSQMTWKVFCKAMRFLQFTKIKLTIEATHPRGRVTIHQTTVEFGTRAEFQTFNEKLNQDESHELKPDFDGSPLDEGTDGDDTGSLPGP